MQHDSHLLHGLQPQDLEALGEHLCGGVAEHDPLHVDLGDVAGLVLLDAVAVVVELGEGRGHLVHELAERVQEEVVRDLRDHLREPRREKHVLSWTLKVDPLSLKSKQRMVQTGNNAQSQNII